MGKALSALSKLLGLHSYRGRYLALVMVFSMVLLAAAYIGQSLVRQTTTRNTGQSTLAAQLLSALGDTSSQLDTLKSDLLNFSIDPVHTGTITVRNSNDALKSAIQRLATLLKKFNSPVLNELNQVLRQDNENLTQQVNELIHIRLSTASWVPASRTMAEEMLPLNVGFRTHLQNLEAMLPPPPDAEALRAKLKQLQVYWLSLVGELRLIVANRFGAFDADTDAAMATRAKNLAGYAEQTRRLLDEVTADLGKLDSPMLMDEFNAARQSYTDWMNAAQRLQNLLAQDDWRKDTYHLHHIIEPTMARMQQRIGAMRLQIQTEAQRLLNQALDNSAILAKAISSVAGGVIVLFLFGYLAFEHWLLRPIEHIAQQMKLEAQGHAPNPSGAPVAETRALVEAFNEMHEQVRAREQRLDHMAHHDALTGLPNRVLFRQRLDRALQQPMPEEQSIAVLFLDLDRFKQINDSHGHLVGDKLLVQVAQRLRSVFRSDDTVARLSGDEFAVLLRNFSNREELTQMAQKVVDTLSPAFEIDDETYHTSASIGLTMGPQDGRDADQLIQHADAAMYHAKACGRSGYCHFTQDLIDESSAQLTLETELYTAVEQRQLELYLQPVVHLRDGRTHGYECLLRWQHPQRGVLTPDDFLATLEDIGLMQRIANWTLDQLGQSGITENAVISMNLPAKLLHDSGFANSLLKRLSGGELNAPNLIVEITEDSISGDLTEAAHRLHALHEHGVRVALDDFGTGQSSLSHLRTFPFDLVKIDRSFIQDIENNSHDAALVLAVINLITSLDIELVVEGIETESQHRLLREKGVRYGQGYLFGVPRPMSPQQPAGAWV